MTFLVCSLLFNASFTLSDPTFSPSALISPGALAVGDLTGDGLLDLVVLSKPSAYLAVQEGAGDGSFANVWAERTLYRAPADVVLADFDQDGLLDIAAINSGCS